MLVFGLFAADDGELFARCIFVSGDDLLGELGIGQQDLDLDDPAAQRANIDIALKPAMCFGATGLASW